jgi:GNAT superfamily N-acetyltransferase
VVGTCGVIPYGGEGSYEIVKMAVDTASQGKGYGRKLMDRAIQWCKDRNGKEIWILTNTVLGPAVEMYKKCGFETVRLGSHPDYERVNIIMKLVLQLPHVHV